MNKPPDKQTAAFKWDDPLLLDLQLSEEERMVRDTAFQYCQDKLLPRIQEAFRNEKTDQSIFREMGELGLLGPTIPAEYGGLTPFDPLLADACAGSGRSGKWQDGHEQA